MTPRIARFVVAFSLLASVAWAAESPQFRGPERDGIFPEEGLLTTWPEAGPDMLWSAEGLGESYASISVVDGHVYTTGLIEGRGFAFALTTDGKHVWKKDYGPEHSGNGYPGTRTTPTVDGEHLYLVSSMGKAVALKTKDGSLAWEVDLVERFGAVNLYFGISESPLVDGDNLILTPGGKDATVVALNKKTGATVWTSKGLGETSAYCNARIFDNGKIRQVITMVQKHMVGLDPANGTVLWRQPYPAEYDIHAVSPVFEGNRIYVSDGYGQGGRLFELAPAGSSVKELWHEEKLDIHHGGAVFLNGHIYGAASKGAWYVLKAETGEIVAEIPRLGKGAVVYADGLLYGYTEKGEVVLVNPDPKDFQKISSFKITKGSGQHWSHPVINQGVLYIRHGEVLMAFDVKAKPATAKAAP